MKVKDEEFFFAFPGLQTLIKKKPCAMQNVSKYNYFKINLSWHTFEYLVKLFQVEKPRWFSVVPSNGVVLIFYEPY